MSSVIHEFDKRFASVCGLVMKVSLLRKEHKFSVTSWWRTEDRNAAVGGIPNSLHLTGEAIDVVLDTTEDAASFKSDCLSIGLYPYDEGDHIHLYQRWY